MNPPWILVHLVRQGMTVIEDQNDEPKRVTIRFGSHALQLIDPAALRSMFSITAIWGVPVSYPEEPTALGQLVVEVDGDHVHTRQLLSETELPLLGIAPSD